MLIKFDAEIGVSPLLPIHDMVSIKIRVKYPEMFIAVLTE